MRYRWRTGVVGAVLAVVAGVCGAVTASADPNAYTYATWNMQGSNNDKWADGVKDLAEDYDIVALQEPGTLGFIDNTPLFDSCGTATKGGRPARRCRWNDGDDYKRVVYFVAIHDGKNNLALVVDPDTVNVTGWDYLPTRQTATFDNGDRGLLQLRLSTGDTVYSAHMSADPLGFNVGYLLAAARTAGGTWLVLGDYNLTPPKTKPALQGTETAYAPTQPTHGTHIYDYLITSRTLATTFTTTRLSTHGSDHHAVAFGNP
ncbi:endonuclease/exonuclease/phosphatase family protein [Actinokineospora terrae]|uniref:Endonuclease/Exonuclease/phosphatase family protein n=1 Tax=Actinokineospora terrae TaxID=155974 RepID=A0A1H9XSR3_9PSEU|nr:endonuclease/exonuclease/phosphatase family protein [Actinokineospora terrae]SES48757.1 Endonuclease/Exonuclease/phosphatase family protein [Actinokineospora terrae]